MAAAAPSVAPSLSSAYAPNRAWLTQDTTNPTGKGPVTTGPPSGISDPVNGTAPVPLNPPPPGFADGPLQAPDYFAVPVDPHAGPWPSLPEESQGKEPFGLLPDDDLTPAGYYKVPPAIQGLEQSRALLPGHDRHSQDTDTAGWEQYTPTGRIAARQGWWQDYLGVEDFWPVTQPNLARTRIAAGGDQNVGGVVASYGDIANSGGSTAYEPPKPPATTPQSPAAAQQSTIPQWGF